MGDDLTMKEGSEMETISDENKGNKKAKDERRKKVQ